jgi:hypothetical protein
MKNVKKVSSLLFLTLLLGILSCEDTTKPATEYTVTVSGQVLRLNNTGLDSIVITLDKPFRRDTVNFDGTFSYSFISAEDADVNGVLTFRHINLSYFDTTAQIVYGPAKKTVSVGEVRMRGLSSAQDSVITGRPSSRPGQIAFVASSLPLISIRGAGSNDATNLTFVVKDSLGVPVDNQNKTTVHFIIITQPDSLVELNKKFAVTSSNGQVIVQLTAGYRAGLAQVQAYTTVKRATDTTQVDTIKSPVVSVTIAGGNPVPSRFTIGSDRVNVPGLVKFNQSFAITAVVGDTFGNPVQQGTLVYFTTTGGIIQPQGATSADGKVSVSLTTGNPSPPGGFATITAQVGTPGSAVISGGNGNTFDEQVIVKGLRAQRQKSARPSAKKSSLFSLSSAPVFSRNIQILFSGSPRITSNDTSFIVPPLGSKQIQFTVADQNGNPLTLGTSIRVSGVGLDTTGAVLTGDLSSVLPDTYDRSFTVFNVSVADKRTARLNLNVPVTITVEVTGDNGNIKKSFTGVLASAVSDSGKVGSIALVNPLVDSIRVAGVGLPNSTVIEARVLTATGQPSENIPVNFTITKSVDGGEYLSSPISMTNSSGIATTTLFSGIKSGTVQVHASVKRDSLAITTDPKNVYIRTGQLASISIVSVSLTSLSVKGGGGTENSIIVFEGRDSLGNPIDVTNQAVIAFSSLGDTLGSKISPSSAKTDPNNGRVTASFASGTRSGIVQIRANAGSIQSPPATLTVSGGFAVDSLFNFTGLQKNYSLFENSAIPISVLIGDQYGNPVKQGTPIAFTSNAGVITASALTDVSGRATASLQIVNDKKLLGTRFVTAKTIGANGTEVSKTKSFILTGAPVITVNNVPSDSVTLFDGASTAIDFEISDSLGNPLSSGNGFVVTTEGSVSSQIFIAGDQNNSFEDSDDRVNDTRFSIVVGDNQPNGGTGGTFKIKIQVNGKSGTNIHTINGRLLAPSNIVIPPSARVAASIALISSSATDLSISGVGGLENATLTYEVRDSVGAPIDLDNKAIVNFKTNFFPNSFTPGGTPPSILPKLDSTDENGRVRVAIVSGTQAGAVQLEAVINLTNPIRTIVSQPVRISVNSGFADQGHFTLAPNRYNFPGLQRAFQTMSVTVQAGDKYSNPVKEGTVVYFNTANGVIQTAQALTNKDGFVSMNLFSSNPYPLAPNLASGLTNGFSRIYARTVGRDSTLVMDSVEILWTGSPIITKTGGPDTYTIANGGSAGPFTFTVADYLGHPMSAGTTINIEASGLSVSGNANINMPDTKSSGAGLTSFTITVRDANATDTDPPAESLITVVVNHPVYGTYKYVLASGTVD